MRCVERTEIVDVETYEDGRTALRQEVLAAKALRRIHVGAHLTFLFENALTVRYQVQEMMRVERIVRESAILHELDTYNDLLGGPGELGCTLLVEIDDPALRARRLAEWIELPAHLYALLEDGSRVVPRYDPAQIGEGKLSSVQYLKFAVGGRVPVAFGCALPDVAGETRLTPAEHAALAADLAS